MAMKTHRPTGTVSTLYNGDSEEWPWRTPAGTMEEHLQRIEALGQRINAYVRFMCQIDSLGGTSAEAKQRAAALNADSAARRRQVEEDFDITMAQRRRDVNRELAQEQATSKTEAKRRVDEATDVARRLVTEADQTAVARVKEATRQVEALRALRRQITSQLQSVSSKLEDALRQLAPGQEPDDVLAGEPAQRN